jgi:hypothetical protein
VTILSTDFEHSTQYTTKEVVRFNLCTVHSYSHFRVNRTGTRFSSSQHNDRKHASCEWIGKASSYACAYKNSKNLVLPVVLGLYRNHTTFRRHAQLCSKDVSEYEQVASRESRVTSRELRYQYRCILQSSVPISNVRSKAQAWRAYEYKHQILYDIRVDTLRFTDVRASQ